MSNELVDRLAIRDLIENWAVWRDAGDWERFTTVWHDDGVMMATWFQGPREGIHPGNPRRMEEGGEHSSLLGRHLHRLGR